MSINKIKLDNEIVSAVNEQLEEEFLASLEVTSDRKIIVNTVDYGSVTYSYEEFFGEPVGSAHDLIKYEVYNKYLVDMNLHDKNLYQLLNK